MTIQIGVERVELAQIRVLEKRPREMKPDAKIGQHLAQNAVTGPVAVGVLVQLGSAGRVLVGRHLHGRVGHDEPRPTVRKDNVRDLGLGADVERLLGIEMLQPGKQIRPEEVRIGLHEDVPFGVILVPERLLNHRQEFPLIQFPARIVGFADSGVGLVLEVVAP